MERGLTKKVEYLETRLEDLEKKAKENAGKYKYHQEACEKAEIDIEKYTDQVK